MTWKNLRHPNMLPLLGVIMNGRHFAMVSEWMTNGSINEYIKANRGANRFELVGVTLSYPRLALITPSDSSKMSPKG
jgi:serine/threonine protein kinase